MNLVVKRQKVLIIVLLIFKLKYFYSKKENIGNVNNLKYINLIFKERTIETEKKLSLETLPGFNGVLNITATLRITATEFERPYKLLKECKNVIAQTIRDFFKYL